MHRAPPAHKSGTAAQIINPPEIIRPDPHPKRPRRLKKGKADPGPEALKPAKK